MSLHALGGDLRVRLGRPPFFPSPPTFLVFFPVMITSSSPLSSSEPVIILDRPEAEALGLSLSLSRLPLRVKLGLFPLNGLFDEESPGLEGFSSCSFSESSKSLLTDKWPDARERPGLLSNVLVLSSLEAGRLISRDDRVNPGLLSAVLTLSSFVGGGRIPRDDRDNPGLLSTVLKLSSLVRGGLIPRDDRDNPGPFSLLGPDRVISRFDREREGRCWFRPVSSDRLGPVTTASSSSSSLSTISKPFFFRCCSVTLCADSFRVLPYWFSFNLESSSSLCSEMFENLGAEITRLDPGGRKKGETLKRPVCTTTNVWVL